MQSWGQEERRHLHARGEQCLGAAERFRRQPRASLRKERLQPGHRTENGPPQRRGTRLA